MSNITEGFRSYFPGTATTRREIGQYVSEEMIDRVILNLEASGYPSLGKVCYVFGAGSQPKSSFTELDRQTGVHVVHFESVLPRGLRFIASFRGLVKINEPSALGGAMRKLMDQATVTALIFDAAFEGAFVESVRNIDKHGDHSFGIKADPGHMIYLVDGDRDDSPTGMVHFLSYGVDGPWKELFDDISESEGCNG